MKILKEVRPLEVKRTFVIADGLTKRKHNGLNNRVYIKALTEKEFEQRLSATKKKVLKMSPKQLDVLISPEWKKRVNSYNASRWFVADMSAKELGVWTRAGNMPLRWTNRSLSVTALNVDRAMRTHSKALKGRPKHAIPNILKLDAQLEQKEKYLYPIVFKSNTGTRGRGRLKYRVKGDIDDGCMRSVALAISGKDPIRVYFGIPTK